MSGNKNIVVFTTRLNSAWISMQEIIPSIESLWSTLSDRKVSVIHCDKFEMKENLAEILKADVFVVTAFNVLIARTLTLLRKKMGVDTPWFFYLHNQATIGLWPLYHWGMGELLTSHDEFISTCKKDSLCFDQLYDNKKSKIIPFHYYPFDDSLLEKESIKEVNDDDFVFIGRLSSQKNLHSLLLAFSCMKDQKAVLHFFGEEDGLGSPNMGMKDKDYKKYLISLCHQLQIEKRVKFHGFVKREIIESMLMTKNIIFVSPSLHSDENFGMAAMRALIHHNRAVLSRWGGHADYREHFSEQVKLVDVYHSLHGPFVDVQELAQAMDQIRSVVTENQAISFYYEKDFSKKLAKELLSHVDRGKAVPLRKTEFLESTLARVSVYKSYESSQIFQSYQDPLAHQYFQHYGALEKDTHNAELENIVPWVKKSGDIYQVEDPHRGSFLVESKEELNKMGYLF